MCVQVAARPHGGVMHSGSAGDDSDLQVSAFACYHAVDVHKCALLAHM